MSLDEVLLLPQRFPFPLPCSLAQPQWKGDQCGCLPAQGHGGHPKQSCCSQTSHEEEEGQKQEMMGAEQASTSPAATPARVTKAGSSCQAKTAAWQPGQPGALSPTPAPPAIPAPQRGTTGRNQLQPRWCGHCVPCSDLPPQHKRGMASAASSSLAQHSTARSEPLPTAGAQERLSPPTGGHIWMLRFGKSYAVKTAYRSV